MVLSLTKLFEDKFKFPDDDIEISCSYLEVYNEIIYDLLVKNSDPLELREDPDLGVQVSSGGCGTLRALLPLFLKTEPKNGFTSVAPVTSDAPDPFSTLNWGGGGRLQKPHPRTVPLSSSGR